MELTDAQWAVLEPLLPPGKSGPGKKGRPRRDSREVLEGILWVLRSGARWKDMPERFPPYQTCHDRFREFVRAGVLEEILAALLADLRDRGKIDLDEAFIDGTFTGAKKGVVMLVQQSAAKGPRSWQLRTAMVFLSRCGLRALRRMR